jgi:hypothetical protein
VYEFVLSRRITLSNAVENYTAGLEDENIKCFKNRIIAYIVQKRKGINLRVPRLLPSARRYDVKPNKKRKQTVSRMEVKFFQ